MKNEKIRIKRGNSVTDFPWAPGPSSQFITGFSFRGWEERSPYKRLGQIAPSLKEARVGSSATAAGSQGIRISTRPLIQREWKFGWAPKNYPYGRPAGEHDCLATVIETDSL